MVATRQYKPGKNKRRPPPETVPIEETNKDYDPTMPRPIRPIGKKFNPVPDPDRKKSWHEIKKKKPVDGPIKGNPTWFFVEVPPERQDPNSNSSESNKSKVDYTGVNWNNNNEVTMESNSNPPPVTFSVINEFKGLSLKNRVTYWKNRRVGPTPTEPKKERTTGHSEPPGFGPGQLV